MFVCLRGDISLMVIFYASDVIEYDRRGSELCNTPLHMTLDTTNTETFKVLRF